MIPKVIHYCWFGGNKQNKIIRKCIASWKKYLPEFKIMEWNENNFDVEQNAYVKQAYEAKMWAYVSDYARMKILYEYGGIYLDTDVEIVKSIPAEIFEYKCIAGIESFSGMIGPGLIFGCHAHDKIVEEVLSSYEKDTFCKTKVENMKTINMRITEILDKHGYIHEDVRQCVAGMDIFPSEIFCGYDGKRRKICITEHTLMVHHYAASWLPWYRKVRLKCGTLMRRIKYCFYD